MFGWFNTLASLMGKEDFMVGVVAAITDNANDAKTWGPKLEKRLREEGYTKEQCDGILQFFCVMHKLGIFSRHIADALLATTIGKPIAEIRKNKGRFNEYKDRVYTFINHIYLALKPDVEKLHFKTLVGHSLKLKKCTAIRFVTFDYNASMIYPEKENILSFLEARHEA